MRLFYNKFDSFSFLQSLQTMVDSFSVGYSSNNCLSLSLFVTTIFKRKRMLYAAYVRSYIESNNNNKHNNARTQFLILNGELINEKNKKKNYYTFI